MYTLNEGGLRALFKLYQAKGCNYLTLEDYERMLIRDAKLAITKEDIKLAFGNS